MFKKNNRHYRPCRGVKLSKSPISAGNIKSHFGHTSTMVKTGIILGVLIDRADGEEAGKLVWALGAPALWDSLAWKAARCHSQMGMTPPWGHTADAQATWGEGLQGRSFWAAKKNPNNYCFQDLVLHLKCKDTNRRGGWMLPLSSAAGTKPQGTVERGLGRSCSETGCLCRKAAPMQASCGARPRRGEQSWQGQALTRSNSNGVTAEKILHASWKALRTSLPDI